LITFDEETIMTRAVYPGSFDPVTFGHMDIIRRSAQIVDELIIGVLVNSEKTPLFTMEERREMLMECVSDLPNVSVKLFEGLTVDFVKNNEATVIIRGVREVTDFESEMQIAQINKHLAPEINTIFLTTAIEYSFLSSTIVREVGKYGGDLSCLVPKCVEKRVREKFSV
jgi:pantetheine-phosphate adenylyltransferase